MPWQRKGDATPRPARYMIFPVWHHEFEREKIYGHTSAVYPYTTPHGLYEVRIARTIIRAALTLFRWKERRDFNHITYEI